MASARLLSIMLINQLGVNKLNRLISPACWRSNFPKSGRLLLAPHAQGRLYSPNGILYGLTSSQQISPSSHCRTGRHPKRWIGARGAMEPGSDSKSMEELAEVEDDFQEEDGEGPEMSLGPSIDFGDAEWGPAVLQCAQDVLQEDSPGSLEIFSFGVKDVAKKVEIRLDKLDNEFGSPGLDDIKEFSSALTRKLEEVMGEEEAGSLEIEVSSPGAEREVRLPRELERFKELPMQVEYVDEAGEVVSQILQIESLEPSAEDGGGDGVLTSKWRIADTKAGRFARKGRKLSKKDREKVIDVPLTNLKKVNLYLDV